MVTNFIFIVNYNFTLLTIKKHNISLNIDDIDCQLIK